MTLTVLTPGGAPGYPLTWFRTLSLEGFRIRAVCARGHTAALDAHKIGSVRPSLVCPEDGCDWHAYARLAGWPDGGRP